jgi:glyoxylase-like metal-dependent hydrolase (beta-lactamase superfamily II)
LGKAQSLLKRKPYSLEVQVDTYSPLNEGSTFPLVSNTFWLVAEQKAVVDLGSLQIAQRLPLDEACCIIITHAHPDHIAALGRVSLLDTTAVLMHAADAEAIGTWTAAAPIFGASTLQFHVDQLLGDGQTIDLGDSVLRVIHTPGHTLGSICLYEADSKSLFSGDTVFPHGGIGRTDLPGGSSQDLIRSISKLAKLDVRVLYPGHGKVTTSNVNEQIKQSLNFAKAIGGLG